MIQEIILKDATFVWYKSKRYYGDNIRFADLFIL